MDRLWCKRLEMKIFLRLSPSQSFFFFHENFFSSEIVLSVQGLMNMLLAFLNYFFFFWLIIITFLCYRLKIFISFKFGIVLWMEICWKSNYGWIFSIFYKLFAEISSSSRHIPIVIILKATNSLKLILMYLFQTCADCFLRVCGFFFVLAEYFKLTDAEILSMILWLIFNRFEFEWSRSAARVFLSITQGNSSSENQRPNFEVFIKISILILKEATGRNFGKFCVCNT